MLFAWAADHIHNPAEGLVFGGALVSAQALVPIRHEAVHGQNWEGRAWRFQVEAAETQVIAVARRAQKDGDPQSWAAEAKALPDPSILPHPSNSQSARPIPSR